MKAIWNGAIIAESDDIVVIEGHHYFPAASVYGQYLRDSDTHTTCPWKGEAHYYHVVVGDQINSDAAWYYPEPEEAANAISNRIAFWKGIDLSE